MSKPDWSESPEWAEWLANDPDGSWYWFELEPHVQGNEWVEWSESGLICQDKFVSCNENWKETLERRP